MFYANGDTFVGEFVRNMKNGYGRYTYSDGLLQEGTYKNNALKSKSKWK